MHSSWLCIDANLVIRLVAEPTDVAVRGQWEQWDADRRQLAAPTLLYYEVTNAIYRYQIGGIFSTTAARLALHAALVLPIRLFGEAEIHQRATRLAARFSLPAAYDAHYLALTEWLGGEFWTTDRRLFQRVHHDLAWIHLLEK